MTDTLRFGPAEEIRCTAAHPRLRGFQCRAKLAVSVGETRVSRRKSAGKLPRDGVELACPRCGTLYLVQAKAS